MSSIKAWCVSRPELVKCFNTSWNCVSDCEGIGFVQFVDTVAVVSVVADPGLEIGKKPDHYVSQCQEESSWCFCLVLPVRLPFWWKTGVLIWVRRKAQRSATAVLAATDGTCMWCMWATGCVRTHARSYMCEWIVCISDSNQYSVFVILYKQALAICEKVRDVLALKYSQVLPPPISELDEDFRVR